MSEEVQTAPEAQVEPPAAEVSNDTDVATQEEAAEASQPAEIDYKAKYEELEQKTKRQTAAYKTLQRKYEETRQSQQTAQQNPSDDEPKEGNFDTYEEYQKAHSEWRENKIREDERNRLQQEYMQQQEQARLAEVGRKFQQSEEEIRSVYPDYDDRQEVINMAISEFDPQSTGLKAFREFMFDSENPALLAYHLGGDLETIDALKSMSPVAMIKKLALFEAGLKAPQKQVIKSQKPTTPLKATGDTTPSVATMSDEEFRKKYMRT